jgi:adenosylcobinamide-phosphate synthase
MYFFELQLVSALCLDLCIGDPRWFPHPVRIIGFFCIRLELFTRSLFTSEYMAGLVTLLTVLLVTIGGTGCFLFLLNLLSPVLSLLFAVFLLYTSVAIRDLIIHSKEVYRQLAGNSDLDGARKAVSMIVGRDTSVLDRIGVIRATVETVAENMVDGVTAPLFYAVLFSFLSLITGVEAIILAALGAIAYKAVNTMDSMFGYKNERYLHFGRSAALLDDLVNWFPARLSGLCLIPAAAMCGFSGADAFIIFMRDRLSHASPNAAHPEAAVAGALGIQLGGTSQYFGKAMVKPVIGVAKRDAEQEDILRTNRLMLVGSLVFFILILFLRQLFLQLIP